MRASARHRTSESAERDFVNALVTALLQRMKDPNNPTYLDYLGVACKMREIGTINDEGNIKKVDRAIVAGATASDMNVRYLSADCMKWLPKQTASSMLMKLQSLDEDGLVREQAAKSLKAIH